SQPRDVRESEREKRKDQRRIQVETRQQLSRRGRNAAVRDVPDHVATSEHFSRPIRNDTYTGVCRQRAKNIARDLSSEFLEPRRASRIGRIGNERCYAETINNAGRRAMAAMPDDGPAEKAAGDTLPHQRYA